MRAIALLFSTAVLLASSPAAADEPLPTQPREIEDLKLHWYKVDGVPYRYPALEGWMLADPAARTHALRRSRMRTAGAALVSFGASAVILGAGLGGRELTDGDGESAWGSFAPAIGGVVLLATGVPLLVFSDKEERRAIEVYGGPSADGARLTVAGEF